MVTGVAVEINKVEGVASTVHLSSQSPGCRETREREGGNFIQHTRYAWSTRLQNLLCSAVKVSCILRSFPSSISLCLINCGLCCIIHVLCTLLVCCVARPLV